MSATQPKPTDEPRMVVRSLRLPKLLSAELRRQAERDGVSMSHVARAAIVAELARRNGGR